MLRTIDALLSQHTHYADKTVDYAALMVTRNAPRWLPGYLATDAGQAWVRFSAGLICDELALAIGRR